MSAPKAGSTRIYRCKDCRNADLYHLAACRVCKRRLCPHGMRREFADGTGVCRSCAWRRAHDRRTGQRMALADRKLRRKPLAPGDGDFLCFPCGRWFHGQKAFDEHLQAGCHRGR